MTLSVPDNFVRLEWNEARNTIPSEHTHWKNTELTLALPETENPNLRPARMAVNTQQKHFLRHKQCNNTALNPAQPDTPLPVWNWGKHTAQAIPSAQTSTHTESRQH